LQEKTLKSTKSATGGSLTKSLICPDSQEGKLREEEEKGKIFIEKSFVETPEKKTISVQTKTNPKQNASASLVSFEVILDKYNLFTIKSTRENWICETSIKFAQVSDARKPENQAENPDLDQNQTFRNSERLSSSIFELEESKKKLTVFELKNGKINAIENVDNVMKFHSSMQTELVKSIQKLIVSIQLNHQLHIENQLACSEKRFEYFTKIPTSKKVSTKWIDLMISSTFQKQKEIPIEETIRSFRNHLNDSTKLYLKIPLKYDQLG
jgi:hypothetical protein